VGGLMSESAELGETDNLAQNADGRIMRGHSIQHPPSGGGWECRCGRWLGVTRSQARDVFRFHKADVRLASHAARSETP
jgi:hypothetical protein